MKLSYNTLARELVISACACNVTTLLSYNCMICVWTCKLSALIPITIGMLFTCVTYVSLLWCHIDLDTLTACRYRTISKT